ncbi:MAG: hypothetical protein IJL58_05855 [Bacteroidales bacterium]|nr:hypothetical protein [Bacteroidales bacterium]
MIGCPGDIREEKDIAIKVINRWTILHAEQYATVLLPIHWTTSSYPEHGDHPQTILNEQLVSNSDMLIGIFGARVGSPTDKSISGTIEEIEEHIKDEKPVMLFFRRQNDTSTIHAAEIEKLQAFKSKVKNHYLYGEYDSPATFEATFANALELFLANKWLSGPKPREVVKGPIGLSDEENIVLKSWIDSNDPDAHVAVYKDGTAFILGSLSYEVTEGRELVQWREFFKKLEQAGFIEQYRTNRQGNPVYQLRTPAYDYVDKLENHE